MYTLAFSCHYASVRCCHRASPYARAAPHTRTKTIRCQQDMRLGQGPSSFDCDPREPFNSHRKALYNLQNSVCFNWTVLTQKSRTCYPIAYARVIFMFSTGWNLSACGTRACNIAEWSRVFRSLIRIFGYRIVYSSR